jgi:hypothetical protein
MTFAEENMPRISKEMVYILKKKKKDLLRSRKEREPRKP